MRHFNILPLLALLILGYSGCETVIPIELPPHTPQLTVNSTFAPDSLWLVNLSSSIGIGELGDPEVIEDGQVLVYADGVLLDTFPHFSDGFYVYPGQPGTGAMTGVSYKIIASAPGFEPVSATTTIGQPVIINSGTLTVNSSTSSGLTSEVTFDFQDPTGDNYYFVAMVYNDSFSSTYPLFLESPDPVLGATPLYSDWYFQGLLFTDLGFDGQLKEVTVNTYENLINGNYKLILGTLTEEYYRYALSYSAAFENEGNPFAEPVRIHSNVDGGYGIFAGFSTSFIDL